MEDVSGMPKGLATVSIPNRRIFHPDSSIVLIGCRGAGKRTLGFIGATYLHRRLLTEDHYFEQATGCSRAQFQEKYGKEALSRQLTATLAQVLQSNRHNCVIECGMATWSRETQELLRQYSETNPILYIHRDKEDIYRMLKLSVADAERFFAMDSRHREYANLEYHNLSDLSGDANVAGVRSASMASARLLRVKEDFTKFLDLISGQGPTRSWVENPFSVKAIPPEHRSLSFVLRLRLSDLLAQEIDWTELESEADAAELIVDTWPSNTLDLIAIQVALIRRKLDLPVIYHVEENPREERQRPQEERDTMDLQLLVHGLRLGVEYLSLDLDRHETLIAGVLSMRGRTKVIGNYTIKGLGAPQWTDQTYLERFQKAQSLGCSVVRFARFCAGDRRKDALQKLVDSIQALPDPKPILVAHDYSVLGAVGLADSETTYFDDMPFSPVGHNAVQASARDHLVGVNTMRGILRLMFRNGHLQPLKFYTLGSKVYYSASPAMHRAAYETLMMPHSFDARKCDTLEELDSLRSETNFGGACLTAPFKVAMMPRVDHLSTHAKAIGAVNILLPLRGRTTSIIDHANARNRAGSTARFYGDNTDWASITTCLRRAISPRNAVQPSRTTGLVIGAGGMARAAIYALIRLGCRKIFICNRTTANAEKVAEHFNQWVLQSRLVSQQGDAGKVCHVLESKTQEWPEGYQQPTIILSCIAAAGDFHDSKLDFRLPPQWLKSPTGGVVVELAYEPLITTLITQMRDIREAGNTSWVIVDGLEVVCEMAIEAFELLTGRKAPRTLMRRVCNENWEKNCAPFEPRR